MLKHGSGMAVCLKYFSNKVSSFVPLVFRQPHVFISNRQVSNDSSLSPLRHECGVSVASSSPDHQMCLDSHVRCEKTLNVQCCTNVIDHVSVFASEDKLLNQPNQLAKSCTFSFSDASFMCYGAEDHFKTACDLEVSHSLSGERKYGGTHLICSSLELLKSGPGDRKEDLSSQGRKEISETFKPPSEEQLEIVARNLATTLPSFFVKPVIMRTIYHHNIVLEDNIRGKRFSGIEQYSFQCQLLYVIGHLRFTYINLDVMKVTSHPEDGTVKVRWRISVFPLSRIWRLKLFNLSASFQDAKDIWIDGFSTYFVLGDGMIHKHIVDKMIPDPDQVTKKPELTKTVPVPNPMAYSDRNKV